MLLYITLSCIIPLAYLLNISKIRLPFCKINPIENINLIYECPSEELPSDFFCNLLCLNNENTRIFHAKSLEGKLLSTGMFRYIKIKKKINHNTITIKYGLNRPIAFSGNKTFQFIDPSGKYYRVIPQFLSRRLPEIFIPESEESYPLMTSECLYHSKEIMKHLSAKTIRYIDLSYIHDYPYEIIVTLRDGSLLLLTTFDLSEKITNYKKLKNYLESNSAITHPLVYDLRFKRSALISVNNSG